MDKVSSSPREQVLLLSESVCRLGSTMQQVTLQQNEIKMNLHSLSQQIPDRMEAVLQQVRVDLNTQFLRIKDFVEERFDAIEKTLGAQKRMPDQDRSKSECIGGASPDEHPLNQKVAITKGITLNFGQRPCPFDKLEPNTAELFAAHNNIAEVKSLLEQAADANSIVEKFELNGKSFTPCSLLAVAVMDSDAHMVKLLLDHRAHPDSKYGFAAGSSFMPWTGPCSVAAIRRGSLNILQCLIDYGADPHATSSNNANLVWQCAYFNKLDMLGYLLERGVSTEIPAIHQDMIGVSHTPLQIAALENRKQAVEMLLAHKADINRKNEMEKQAIDDAIDNGRPAICSLLFSAHVKRVAKSSPAIRSMTSSRMSTASLPREYLANVAEPMERAFDARNSLVISAMAQSFRGTEVARYLTIDEVLRFLTTPGDAPQQILRALFLAQKVSYWRGEDKLQRCDISTAFIRQGPWLPNGSRMASFHVESIAMTSEYLRASFRERSPLHPKLLAALELLAPQRCPSTRWQYTKEFSMTSVLVYEGLVPHLHTDLRIIKAIMQLNYESTTSIECRAIIRQCWKETRPIFVVEVIVVLIEMFAFIAIAIALNQADVSGELAAVCGTVALACTGYHLVNEILQLIGFSIQGWLYDYVTEIGNYVDIVVIAGDTYVLCSLVARGRSDFKEWLSLSVILSLLSFHKWMKVMHLYTSFSHGGPAILPILHSMWDSTTFFLVLLFHVLGLCHAMLALQISSSVDIWNTWKGVYELSVLGVSMPWDWRESFASEGVYYSAEAIYMLAALFVSTTLMNVFIAALGNSFNRHTDRMEAIFESTRMDAILKNMARRDGVRKIIPSLKDDKDEGLKSLWFCCPE